MSTQIAASIGLAMVAVCSTAAAQGQAEDYIEPRVTRQQFMALIEPLELGSDQRTIVELAFSDYSAAMTDLAQQLDAQAAKAGRQAVHDALSGKSRMAAEELARTRVAVLRVYQEGWPVVDEALDGLLSAVESVLTSDQAARYDASLRELRRSILLHPRQAESEAQEYAGDGVDVLLLAQTALGGEGDGEGEGGGELANLPQGALQELLSSYEHQLDALLTQTAAAHRAGKLARKIATIEKDAAALRQYEHAALERWKQLYQLNQGMVHHIAELAAANLGPEAQQRWLDRFDRASFTWLYPRKKPDRQIEWIRQEQLTAETRQQAEAVYETYLDRRHTLSRQAIGLMIKGRLEFQTMLYSMMDPTGMDDRIRRGLYEELLKNTGEQANLENTTSGALEALLSPPQREAMRNAMKRPDAVKRRS